MSRWKVDADANEETAGGGGGNFSPAPRGIYAIQVADYKDGITQTKRPMVTLVCEVADDGPEFGKKVWLTVTQIPKGEKGHGIMVHSLHAFGLEYDGSLDFDTSEFQGRRASALLGVKILTKVKDGKTYNNEVNFVEALYTDNHPEPDELPPAREQRTASRGATPQREPARTEESLEEVPF